MLQHPDKAISHKFNENDWVLLDAANLPRNKVNAQSVSKKLSPRFVGPYKIVQRQGEVNYRLELPSSWRIHPVFHADLLIPYFKRDTSLFPNSEIIAEVNFSEDDF
jgi:hypothetical protein